MNNLLLRLIISSFFLVLIGCSDSSNDIAEASVAEAQSAAAIAAASVPAASPEPVLVELKLIDAQDDERGYCVDVFDHLTRAQTIAGLQAHNCFLYFGRGPTEDQGFDAAFFAETGQLKVAYFDLCMEVHNPNPGAPGSFVALEGCAETPVQTFEMTAEGRVIPEVNPDLCLTIGDLTVPGGPRIVPPGSGLVFPPANNDAVHTIRRLTFSQCSEDIAELQKWEFRLGEFVADNTAELNRFIY